MTESNPKEFVSLKPEIALASIPPMINGSAGLSILFARKSPQWKLAY